MSDAADQPWPVLRLINWTREYFTRAGLDSPRLAAEVLLAHVLGGKRIELYTRHEHIPAADELAAYRGLVQRAADGEPIAYLVGYREFYSLRFTVTPDVLIPRPETELLVDQALAHLKALDRPAFAWDACTGCGCVAVALAANAPAATVLATDISPAAVTVAEQNAAAHGLANRVTCRPADLLTLPDDWPGPHAFDTITANPPYVTEGANLSPTVAREPDTALRGGPDGLDLIRRIVPQAAGALAPGGRLIMEFGIDQRDAVTDIFSAVDAFAEPTIVLDHQSLPRVVVAARR